MNEINLSEIEGEKRTKTEEDWDITKNKLYIGHRGDETRLLVSSREATESPKDQDERFKDCLEKE